MTLEIYQSIKSQFLFSSCAKTDNIKLLSIPHKEELEMGCYFSLLKQNEVYPLPHKAFLNLSV